MNKCLLVTRPKYDMTTHYLYVWTEKVLEIASKIGIKVLDLSKKRANKKTTTSMLKKMKPLLVFFNGHGHFNCIRGHDNELIIESPKDNHLLKSKIIYARSCKAGIKFGPECIKAGALAFIGYNNDFIFFTDKDKVSQPLKDEIAKLFLEPSNYVVISILKGHNVRDSHLRSVRKIRENIQSLSSSEADKNYLVPYLAWNMMNQVCLGDTDACF